MMKSIVVMSIFLTLAIACSKKNNNDGTIPLSKAALLGKWNFISERDVIKDSTTGTILFDTTDTNFPNSYFDFRNNDNVYKCKYNSDSARLLYDTLSYTTINNQIILTSEVYAPKIVTVTQLTKDKLVGLEVIKNGYRGQPAFYQYTYTFTR